MLPDRVSNPGPLAYESGALPIACKAEARHMYCFSGVDVIGSGGVNIFCVKVIFSETIRARAMKLGSCIHLEELRSTLIPILSLDLLFMVH